MDLNKKSKVVQDACTKQNELVESACELIKDAPGRKENLTEESNQEVIFIPSSDEDEPISKIVQNKLNKNSSPTKDADLLKEKLSSLIHSSSLWKLNRESHLNSSVPCDTESDDGLIPIKKLVRKSSLKTSPEAQIINKEVIEPLPNIPAILNCLQSDDEDQEHNKIASDQKIPKSSIKIFHRLPIKNSEMKLTTENNPLETESISQASNEQSSLFKEDSIPLVIIQEEIEPPSLPRDKSPSPSCSDKENFFDDSDNDLQTYEIKSKWCICDRDNITTADSKICEQCTQWYHLKCLNYDEKSIENIVKNRGLEEFICPVCKNDQEFIQKYKKKINFRTQHYSRYLTSSSDRSDTEISDNENLKPASVPKVIIDDFNDGFKPPDNFEITKKLSPKRPAAIGFKKKHEITKKDSNLLKPSSSKDLKKPDEKQPLKSSSDSINRISTKLVVYTADSTGQPIEVRRNLKCMSCRASLKEKNHPVPKKIRIDYTFNKDNKNISEAWFDSIYCDDKCILNYLDEHLTKTEHKTAKKIDLLDSITKRRQKSFFTENYKTFEHIKKKMYEFLAVNPKYFIMNKKYKESYGPREKILSKPVSVSKPIKVLSNTKHSPVDKPYTEKPVKQSVTPQPVIKSMIADYTSYMTPEREKVIKQIVMQLKGRYNITENKADLKIDINDIEKLVERIELECHKFFIDPKKYINRMRAIIMNITNKSNQTFYLKILDGRFTPEDLPKITTEQMGDDKLNDERSKQRAEDLRNTKKYSDECNMEKIKPSIKKTSKGEEYVGDHVITMQSHFDGIDYNQSTVVETDESSQSSLEVKTKNKPKETTHSPTEPIARQSNHSQKLSPIIETKFSSPKTLLDSNHDTTSHSQKLSPIIGTKFTLPKTLLDSNHDTTSQHCLGKHIMDVNCKICLGESNSRPISEILDIIPKENVNSSPLHIPNSDIERINYLKERNEFFIRNKSLNNSLDELNPPPVINFNSSFEPTFSREQSPTHDKLSSKFWSGEIVANGKNVISLSAEMVGNSPGSLEVVKKITEVSFPDRLDLGSQLPMNNKRMTFWVYLEYLKENLNAKLVFFNLNSNGEKKSKLYVPSRDPIIMDDNDMFSIFFNHLIESEKIFEYKVPTYLQDTIGCIYVAPLKNKNQPECPRLKTRFGISMPRNKDQLVGVIIDYETKKKFRLPADFGQFSPSLESIRTEAHLTKRKSHELDNEHTIPEIPIEKKRSKYSDDHHLKRKSTDNSNENKEEIKRSKTISSEEKYEHFGNSFPKNLPSETLSSPVQSLKTFNKPISKDPRDSSSRDPRLKHKNSLANEKTVSESKNFENTTSQIEPPKEIEKPIETESLDAQIQDFSLRVKSNEMSIEEATICVQKFITTNELSFVQKATILNTLTEFRERMTVPNTEVINQVNSPVTIISDSEAVNSTKPSGKQKRKKPSRFSDPIPLNNKFIPISSISKSHSDETFNKKPVEIVLDCDKSETYLAIDRLLSSHRLNVYHSKNESLFLSVAVKKSLNEILEADSNLVTKLNQKEIKLLKADYAKAYPELLYFLNSKSTDVITLDENENEIITSKSQEFQKFTSAGWTLH